MYRSGLDVGRSSWLLVLLALASFTGAARADDGAAAQAKQLYENGVLLYDEGEYEKSITAWRRAYELSQEPLLLYNIANALERLGRIREAIDTLNEYRIYAPAEERDTLERRLSALERRLAEEPAAPTQPSVDQPATPPAVVPTVAQPAVIPPEPPPEKDRHPLRAVGVALLGVGAGAAGAGAGLYASASARASEALGHCVDGAGGLLCASPAEAPADQSRSLATGGHVSWAAAGALLVSGAVMVALDGRAGGVAVVPTPTQGGAGLLVVVRR